MIDAIESETKPEKKAKAASAPIGALPCKGCWRREKCERLKLACDAYLLYRRHCSPARWQVAPRHPTADLYERAHSPPPSPPAPRVSPRPAAVQELFESEESL
jgi:hypothetical protein